MFSFKLEIFLCFIVCSIGSIINGKEQVHFPVFPELMKLNYFMARLPALSSKLALEKNRLRFYNDA